MVLRIGSACLRATGPLHQRWHGLPCRRIMSERNPSTTMANLGGAAPCAKALLFNGLRSANLAYVLALARSSVMNRDEGRALIRNLLELNLSQFGGDIGELPRFLDHTLQRSGSSTTWLGADRSKLEAVGAAFLIAIRKRILDLAHAHLGFAEITVALASQHRDTLIPTPGNQTKETVSTLGHCLLTYVYPAFRDLERLQHCYRNFNSSPCGAGRDATGARLALDLELLRTLLGFDAQRAHSTDALWQSDGPIELMAACVALLVNLNRLADDLRPLADAAHSTDAAWIRSLTSGLLAKVPLLAAMGKEHDGNAEGCAMVAEELCSALNGSIRAIELLTSLVTRSSERAASVEGPVIFRAGQSDLAEVFVTRGGIDYPSAQKMVEEIDRLIAKGELALPTLTIEAVDIVAMQIVGRPVSLTTADLVSAIQPGQMIGARRSPGGVAPERVIEMITECRARLVRENLWVTIAGQRLIKSEALLLAEACEAAGV